MSTAATRTPTALTLALDTGSLIVSASLLFTGLIHAAQPYLFIHTISSYHLLSPAVGGILGLWLPYLQIVLSICIAFRIVEKAANSIAAGLFTLFATAQLAVLLRGMEIDCGCFGFVAHKVSSTSVVVPALMAVICFLAQIRCNKTS